ncbi:hypothetical protein ACIPVA_03760 [Streptomyces anulatus]
MSDDEEMTTGNLLSGEDRHEAEQSGEARLDALDEERWAAEEAAGQHEEDEYDDEEGLMGTEPEPKRDIQAVMEASNYVQHGCSTMHGGSVPDCICP